MFHFKYHFLTYSIFKFMKYRLATKDQEKNNLIIEIRLDDECKNGHQDFAITGTGYKAGRPQNDRSMIYGGCCHDEILKAHPEFKLFVDLHLCDYKGAPMYAVSNGRYHMKDKKTAMDYLRITEAEYDSLYPLKDSETDFAAYLYTSGIVDRWESEAKKAIELLEKLTGEKFVNTSKKQQFEPPKEEHIKQYKKRMSEGYFSPENIAARLAEKKENEKKSALEEIRSEAENEITKIKLELSIKEAIINAGLSIENFIFYTHSNEGVFNWKDYVPKVTQEEFNQFIQLNKIEGITFKLK